MRLEECRLILQGRWVRGIIDQLQVGPDGRLAVVEHKTRSRPTLPRPAQVHIGGQIYRCGSTDCGQYITRDALGAQDAGPAHAAAPGTGTSCGPRFKLNCVMSVCRCSRRHTGWALWVAHALATSSALIDRRGLLMPVVSAANRLADQSAVLQEQRRSGGRHVCFTRRCYRSVHGDRQGLRGCVKALGTAAQVRATEMQVALYRHMLAGLARLSNDQVRCRLAPVTHYITSASECDAVTCPKDRKQSPQEATGVNVCTCRPQPSMFHFPLRVMSASWVLGK